MSKQRRPIDEIAPDGLVEQVDSAETIDDAIHYLHKFAESSTPREDRPRCPECGTVRIAPSTGDPKQKPGDHDHDYICNARHKFDNPAPPIAEVDDGAAEESAEESDPFLWVTHDDLADPPLRRLLPELADETKTALAIFWYRPWNHTDADPSYRDLGYVFGYSRQWVGERVRAWQRGEYRDIVRDPRPRVTIATDAEEVSAE